MSFQLRKATRKTAKLRIGLSAASGFGKTYSALLLAYGITGDWSKIALIDTENGSGELYSHLGDYNALTLVAPFHPERYAEAIRACEAAGMEVIIIDSISHEWEGTGGCLELADQLAAQKYRGNSYVAWGEVTPRHQTFINAILQSPAHIITTVRRKQAHEISTNDRGKTTVTKVGTKEVTRDGFEYELTLSFELVSDHHIARASKDRTGLFMGQPEFVISEETGKLLKRWADEGIDPLTEAITAMQAAPDLDTLQFLWSGNRRFQETPSFVEAKDMRKEELLAA
ncbi:MAG: AAA family ATPase [Janthinobacterium lividum]